MTYTLPAAITAGTFYRFFVGDCPYDAELEYIKGDGTSWINTDYVPSSANKVEMQMLFEAFLSGASGYEAFFCARNTSSKNTFMAIHIDGNIRIDRLNSAGIKTIKAPATWTKYLFKVDYTGGAVETNLVSATTGVSGTAYTAGGKLALFTDHSMGNNVTSSMGISHPGRYRLYSFKLLDQRGGGFTAGRELSVAVASSQTCLFGTLAVDSVNFSTSEITLSFPSLPTNATIWAVYGTTADAGAYSPNGWDHYVKAADVAAGATSATFTLQDLAGVSDTYPYKALRFVMAWDSGKTTPYDYQIEYIYATSGNYVDTGIVPYSTDTAAAKVNVRAYGNWPVWSARQASNNRTFTCFAHNSKFFRFDRYNSYATQSGTFSLNKDYLLEADYKTRIYNVTGEISGSKTGLMGNPGDFTPGSSLYLFAANNNGSVGSDSNLYLYWFTLQLWDGSLRRDLIPVVKDGAACLYDTVTDAIMTQTGTFTAGWTRS